MTTANDLIKRAMRLAGALGKGETPDDDEAQDGLTALNSMLDSWKTERLAVFQIVQASHTWASGQSSRTIGESGSPSFSAQRPVRIDSAIVTDSNSNDYPLTILLDRTEYDSIVVKTTESSLPSWLFYDPAYPNGTLYLYPVPSAQVTLKLNTWQTLQLFDTLTEELSLPPGYERAIVYNLALELAPEFGTGRKIDPQVPSIAIQSKAAIKTLNQPSMVSQLDSGIAYAGKSAGGRYNIFTDQ